MSDTYPVDKEKDTPDPLSLGSDGYQPTQPAPYFVDPFASTGSSDPSTGFGQPPSQPYGTGYTPAPEPTPQPQTSYQDPSAAYGYSVYDPNAYPASPYPAQPQYPAQQSYAMTPYVANSSNANSMSPGQVIQTAYGVFTVGPKSKLAAGLLGIFLGSIGVGQFYRGNIGLGILQIVVTLVTCGVGALWGFIEGIVVLVAQPGTPSSLDSNGMLMSS